MCSSDLIVAVVAIIVIFGVNKLPQIARNMGKAQSEFKKGLKEGATAEDLGEGAAPPQAAAPAPAPEAAAPAAPAETPAPIPAPAPDEAAAEGPKPTDGTA